MLANNINLFKNSIAWELAKAVEKEDVLEIRNICLEEPALLGFQENKYGQTLLQWAVYTDRYYSAEALVELGAVPNIQAYNGTSAFIHACNKNNTTKYVSLLLAYGGDVNAIATPLPGTVDNVQQLKTPLIVASNSNIESVKLLVEAGANINYVDDQHQSALHEACLFDKIEIIRYLVIEKGAAYRSALSFTINGDSLYVHNLLRNMTFPLESKEFKIKMEVVQFLKERGMNYWETKIPSQYFKNYTKEYLEKY